MSQEHTAGRLPGNRRRWMTLGVIAAKLTVQAGTHCEIL